MKLTLESLKEHGAFTGRPVEKEITWKQGEKELTATVFIRPPGYHAALQGIHAAQKNSDTIAVYISSCVCDEHGNAVFTPEDITGESDPERGPLDGPITVAILLAIQEVVNLGKTTN